MALTNQVRNTASVTNQTSPNFGFSNLLLENGSALLLENGDNLLLELGFSVITSLANQARNTAIISNQTVHYG